MKHRKTSGKVTSSKNKESSSGSKEKFSYGNKPLASSSHGAVTTTKRGSTQYTEVPQSWSEKKRLFLGVGDEVTHLRYEEWGIGIVMEVMTSSVPGGTCLARIRFQDGQLRCFNNDLDNETCCYYFGVRRYWNPTHGVNAFRAKFFALKG